MARRTVSLVFAGITMGYYAVALPLCAAVVLGEMVLKKRPATPETDHESS